MPHDSLGNILKVGDHVTILCVVESIQMSEEFCNATVRTVHPMPPYKDGMTITLNTKQTQKCEKLANSEEGAPPPEVKQP